MRWEIRQAILLLQCLAPNIIVKASINAVTVNQSAKFDIEINPNLPSNAVTSKTIKTKRAVQITKTVKAEQLNR